MANDTKQPKTRQQPKLHGRVVDIDGSLIADTKTGFRDEEKCKLVRQRLIEAGYWQVVRTETSK